MRLNHLLFSLTAAALLSISTSELTAGPIPKQGGTNTSTTISSPEIDSGAATGAVALLVGSVLLLRDRFLGLSRNEA